MNPDGTAAQSAQLDVSLGARVCPVFQQSAKALPVLRRYKRVNADADDRLQGGIEDGGKAVVAIRNDAVWQQSERPVAHAFDENAVGFVRALQKINLFASRTLHDDSIDLPAADCGQSLFGFLQT